MNLRFFLDSVKNDEIFQIELIQNYLTGLDDSLLSNSEIINNSTDTSLNTTLSFENTSHESSINNNFNNFKELVQLSSNILNNQGESSEVGASKKTDLPLPPIIPHSGIKGRGKVWDYINTLKHLAATKSNVKRSINTQKEITQNKKEEFLLKLGNKCDEYSKYIKDNKDKSTFDEVVPKINLIRHYVLGYNTHIIPTIKLGNETADNKI